MQLHVHGRGCTDLGRVRSRASPSRPTVLSCGQYLQTLLQASLFLIYSQCGLDCDMVVGVCVIVVFKVLGLKSFG